MMRGGGTAPSPKAFGERNSGTPNLLCYGCQRAGLSDGTGGAEGGWWRPRNSCASPSAGGSGSRRSGRGRRARWSGGAAAPPPLPPNSARSCASLGARLIRFRTSTSSGALSANGNTYTTAFTASPLWSTHPVIWQVWKRPLWLVHQAAPASSSSDVGAARSIFSAIRCRCFRVARASADSSFGYRCHCPGLGPAAPERPSLTHVTARAWVAGSPQIDSPIRPPVS